jgi:hypothetical protein
MQVSDIIDAAILITLLGMWRHGFVLIRRGGRRKNRG